VVRSAAAKGRRCEVSTTPPDTPSRHLLPCHVRLLDGTDLYLQIVVSVPERHIEVEDRDRYRDRERWRDTWRNV
jgi:hypothetical protein